MAELKTVECYTHHVPAPPERQCWAVRRSVVLHIEAETLAEARREYDRVMERVLWLAANHRLIRRQSDGATD